MRADTPAPYAFDQALPLACAMYSLDPARGFGVADRIGSVAPGKAGDAVVVDVSGEPGAYRVKVERVYLGGSQAKA